MIVVGAWAAAMQSERRCVRSTSRSTPTFPNTLEMLPAISLDEPLRLVCDTAALQESTGPASSLPTTSECMGELTVPGWAIVRPRPARHSSHTVELK